MSFNDLSLPSSIVSTLTQLGFTTPTDIQGKAIPILMGPGKVDFLGQAQTGTGKTLAFGLPLLARINPSDRTVQALIVAPTRELVVQITQSLKPIAQPLGISIEPIYGGVSMSDQLRALKRGVQVVVGTPGRLNDHIKRKTLILDKIHTLVLDEADIMLDMGFKEEVDEIMAYTPSDRQIWLFSATIKPGISQIMREHMKNTVSVRANKQQIGCSNTKQFYAVVPSRNRFAALCRFIDATPSFYGFVFCQTKALTADVAEQLSRAGYKANALHGDMSQAQRNHVIAQFKSKKFTILVATDVAARGIDVADLTHVINYSLPTDHESYVHRIGRTGRAGKEGIAISLISSGEVRKIRMLERQFNVVINPMEVPSVASIAQVHIAHAAEYVNKLAHKQESHDAYAADIKKMLSSYDAHTLTHILTQMLDQTFFEPLKKMQDVSFESTSHKGGGHEYADTDGDGQEIMIHLGTDDGFSREELVDILENECGLKADSLDKLKVIKRRSFIKVPHEQAQGILDKLKNIKINGKRVRVTLSHDEPFPSRRPERSGRDRDDRRGFRHGRDRGGHDRGGFGDRRRRH